MELEQLPSGWEAMDQLLHEVRTVTFSWEAMNQPIACVLVPGWWSFWSQGIGYHHWLSSSKLDHILSFSGQAWGGVLIWEANDHSSYAREVPKTILILFWIGLPLENWCMCLCIVWIRYLELMNRVWSWIKPFDDGRRSEERGRQKNQPHEEFQAVLSVKQGRHWC